MITCFYHHHVDPFRRRFSICVKNEKPEINSGNRNGGYPDPIPTVAPVAPGLSTNATHPERNPSECDQLSLYASVYGYDEPIPTPPPRPSTESGDYLQATKTHVSGNTSSSTEDCSATYQKLHTYIDIA